MISYFSFSNLSKFLAITKFSQINYFRNSCNTNMRKTALVLLAPGAEEMEFTISADVLRRAGVDVTVAGLENSDMVTCSRDVKITPDTCLKDVILKTYDAVVLPGGMGGSEAFAASATVGELLKKQEAEGRIIAVMCAAPIALLSHGICLGRRMTSYPSLKDKFLEKYSYIDEEKVVQDGILITSRGPGTAFDFALKISSVLVGDEKTKEVAKAMLLCIDKN